MASAPPLSRADRLRAGLDARSRPAFLALATVVALGLSLLRFAPKLWLMAAPPADNFEWSRALNFLHQCLDPFTTAVTPAVCWRLLPPLAAHALGLTGPAALLIPYVGLVALVATWIAAAEHLLGDRLAAALLGVLLTTSGAVLAITGWLGINDGWYLLGLVALATGTGRPSLLLTGVLAPWVDERFLLAWPLALAARYALQRGPAGFGRQVCWAGAALLPYLGLRLGGTLFGHDRQAVGFAGAALRYSRHYLACIDLGWLFGLRAAWTLVAVAAWAWLRGPRAARAWGLGAALLALGSATVLAADLSRSTGVLLPLLLVGAAAWPNRASLRPWLLGLGAANLLLPAAMVSDTAVIPIWSLPVELYRLLRATSG